MVPTCQAVIMNLMLKCTYENIGVDTEKTNANKPYKRICRVYFFKLYNSG